MAQTWDNEKKLLESNPPVGEIACVNVLDRESYCEITEVQNYKFLVRYTLFFAGVSEIYKKYIIYDNTVRYEMSPGAYLEGNDPDEPKFIGNENIDWVYKKFFQSSKN